MSQKIACEPYDADCPMASMARIAQTVKKIRSKRKSDFLSLLFSAKTSADAADAANAYPPCVFGSWAEPERQFEPDAMTCQGPSGQIDPRYTPRSAARI